ncbi:non-homologous end-joining factor 1 isoform X2 [Genypterus blacodes]
MRCADIQSRAQELNKRLRAPVKAFFSHLCEVVRPCLTGSGGRAGSCEAQISLTHQEDGNISMRVKSELAGLPFYWEFHCTPAPVTMVCTQLVRPLLLMNRVLQRQVEDLEGLLVRKDAEIQDYRENGATLSRERLKTDVFVEQTYREDFITKTLPQVCSGTQDGLGFDEDLHQLYTSVVSHTCKRKLSETQTEEEEQTVAPEAELTPTLGDEGAGEQSQQVQQDAAGAKIDHRPAGQQSRPIVDPTERSSSKRKKKKVIGLFR